MQGPAESDVELLAIDLKTYMEKLDDQRTAFTSEHQTDMATLLAELEGIRTQMKKLQGKYDDIPPPTPTSSPTATTAPA